jgi:hypothetical protein
MLVTIPLNGDIDRTLADVRALLKAAMAKRRQRLKKNKKPGHSNARYPVHTMPVLTSLHQTLRIWQAKKALPAGATLAEIGEKAGFALAKDYGRREGSSVALTTTTVHRCVKAAESLIYNVGQGRFPDVTLSPGQVKAAAEKSPQKEVSLVKTKPAAAAKTPAAKSAKQRSSRRPSVV